MNHVGTAAQGAVVPRAARFKYSESTLSVQESMPGPGSYNTVPAKDLYSSQSRSRLQQAKKPMKGLSKEVSREDLQSKEKNKPDPLDDSSAPPEIE